MELTRNPLVDTGLTVMAHLSGKSAVSELGKVEIRRLVGDGNELAQLSSGR